MCRRKEVASCEKPETCEFGAAPGLGLTQPYPVLAAAMAPLHSDTQTDAWLRL